MELSDWRRRGGAVAKRVVRRRYLRRSHRLFGNRRQNTGGGRTPIEAERPFPILLHEQVWLHREPVDSDLLSKETAWRSVICIVAPLSPCGRKTGRDGLRFFTS